MGTVHHHLICPLLLLLLSQWESHHGQAASTKLEDEQASNCTGIGYCYSVKALKHHILESRIWTPQNFIFCQNMHNLNFAWIQEFYEILFIRLSGDPRQVWAEAFLCWEHNNDWDWPCQEWRFVGWGWNCPFSATIFRHARVSSTYPSKSVGWLVILLNFHSISVSDCSTWKVEERWP